MKRSFPTTKLPDANTIEVEVYYRLGGYNYFTGAEEPRGCYLGVQPVNQSHGWRSFKFFSGKKLLLEETKRKSAKRLAEWWARIEPGAENMARAFEAGDHARIVELARQSDGEAASAGDADDAQA